MPDTDPFSIPARFANYMHKNPEHADDLLGILQEVMLWAEGVMKHLISCPDHDLGPGDEHLAAGLVSYSVLVAGEELRRICSDEMGVMDELVLLGVVAAEPGKGEG